MRTYLTSIVLFLAFMGVSSSAQASFPANQDISSCYLSGYGYAYGVSPIDACLTQATKQLGPWWTVKDVRSNPNLANVYHQNNPSTPQVSNVSYTVSSAYVCPVNSTLSTDTCTCDSGYIEDSGSCVFNDSPLAQAAQDAYDAAINAGRSPEAAQQAKDAVLDHPELSPEDWSHVGSLAALEYDRAVTSGVDVVKAASISSGSVDHYVTARSGGIDALDAAILATNISTAVIDDYAARVAAGNQPSDLQLAASIAAGGLAASAAVAAFVGAAPIATILLASGALHAAIIAANIDTTNPRQVAAVVAAGSSSIGSSATPFQVNIITKAAADAALSASSDTAAQTGAVVANSVITAPLSDWNIQTQPETVQVSAATAAAKAAAVAAEQFPYAWENASAAAGYSAANTIFSGGTPAQAASSATVAATAAASGFNTDGAVGGSTASGTVTASGGSTDANAIATALGAGLGELKGLLQGIKDLLGKDGAIDSNPAKSDGRAATTATNNQNAIDGMLSDALAVEEGDEQSVYEIFSLDLPAASCSPFTGSVHGYTVALDLCQYTEHIRELLGWLFALFGAYSVFQTVFRPRA